MAPRFSARHIVLTHMGPDVLDRLDRARYDLARCDLARYDRGWDGRISTL